MGSFFISSCSAIELPAYDWQARGDSNSHPTNSDPIRGIWRSAENAYAGVITLFWGGARIASSDWATPPIVVVGAGFEPALE